MFTTFVEIMLVVFILVVLWMVHEIKNTPLLDEPVPCPYCRDTGYVRFEVWRGVPEVGQWPTREVHERPCTCTAGIGKERRKIA